jgi:hypothetical protein
MIKVYCIKIYICSLNLLISVDQTQVDVLFNQETVSYVV